MTPTSVRVRCMGVAVVLGLAACGGEDVIISPPAPGPTPVADFGFFRGRWDVASRYLQPDGTFVNEVIIAPDTLSQGSTWDVAFSPDDAQRFMYLADGQNMKVYVMDRQSLEVLYSFGDGGRQPGLFFAVHSIATDSSGNIYTTETYEGTRIQKFTYRGMGANPGGDMGAAWPTDRRRSD